MRRRYRSDNTKMKFVCYILLLAALNTNAVTLPFDPGRGLVEVEVVIDGRVKGKFGIDTGADRIYVDRPFAVRHGLNLRPAIPQREIVSVEGSAKAIPLSINSLTVGDETSYALKATAVDLGPLLKDTTHGYPDGLLGFEFLRRFYVSVNYPGSTIELNSSRPRFLNGNQYEAVPYRSYRHLILVDVTFDKGVTAPMMLDYCASYTAISPILAGRLGLDADKARVHKVKSIRIGDKVITQDVPVAITDLRHLKKSLPRAQFEGILGATFLWPHRITIDYKAKVVYVRK